jgi:bifunctional non-homologous end joining protein LigD
VAAATTTIEVGERSITLTSQSKKMFPDAGISKGELVEYYLEVAPWMLQHVAGRPLTLQVYPAGIGGHKFYQKNLGEHFPEWMARATMISKDEGETIYAIADEAATLVYLANQNCITFHVCSAKLPRLDRPDLLILDLDPSDEDFEKIREGALALRPMLTELGLVPYVKTSGSRGLHVVAPIVPGDDHDAVRHFSRTIAERLCRLDPERFTIETSKKRRGTRVFVDYLRNGVAQTVAAPYTVRGLPGAPVATPLRWEELEDPHLHARKYTLRNVRERLREVGDPWRDIYRDARPLAD